MVIFPTPRTLEPGGQSPLRCLGGSVGTDTAPRGCPKTAFLKGVDIHARLGALTSQTSQLMGDLRPEARAHLAIHSFYIIVVSLVRASNCVKYQFLLYDLGQGTISAHIFLICKTGTLQDLPQEVAMGIR